MRATCVLDFCRGAINNEALHIYITGGYKELFPVQAAAWRETAGGCSAAHDLCICAPTGSGKTLAYALPIVAALTGCALPPKHVKYLHAMSVSACAASDIAAIARASAMEDGVQEAVRQAASHTDNQLCTQNVQRLSLRLTFVILLTGG